MKSTQKKYTKEQFVKEFLRKQAQAKAARELEVQPEYYATESVSYTKDVDYYESIDEKVEIEEPVTAIFDDEESSVEEEFTNEKVDLTDVTEVFEAKTVVEQSEKVIDISPLIRSKKSAGDNTLVKTIEDVKSAIEEEEELFNSNKNIVFEVEIEYSSSDLSFNGLNLLEEELRDGNLQVGFDINVGTFVGNTITKIVRKKKAKVKFEDLYYQLSFE